MSLQHMQIGEVAERVGLSLRTIRYYEEVGLVPPSARTTGGFRLYTEPDVARLCLIKRMKTLEFSLDEMKELLAVLNLLEISTDPQPVRDQLVEQLTRYRSVAEERCAALRGQLETAEAFAEDLRCEVSRQNEPVEQPR